MKPKKNKGCQKKAFFLTSSKMEWKEKRQLNNGIKRQLEKQNEYLNMKTLYSNVGDLISKLIKNNKSLDNANNFLQKQT